MYVPSVVTLKSEDPRLLTSDFGDVFSFSLVV